MDNSNFDELPLRIKSQLRRSLRIKTSGCTLESLPIGSSRIGGCPDVPSGFVWPRYSDLPLSFVAQFNLGDMPRQSLDIPLPQTGSLLFFYDSQQRTWGFDPKDRGSAVVLYTTQEPNSLTRIQPPEDMPDMGWFKCCKVDFDPAVNLPDAWSIHYRPELSGEERDNLFEYYDRSQLSGPIHRIGGHADCVQNAMELECQLVTHGLYCGDSTGYEDPRRETLQEGASDWKLLLQIDSDDDAGMMWGDVGRIYFWLRETDLQEQHFENAWQILQCG